MYSIDNNIKLPQDTNTIVWKYLDLSKFVDLLLTRQLFMSRSESTFIPNWKTGIKTW